MKEKIKTIYYCDFCGKKGMVKGIIEYHENYCLKNPVNFSKCFESCRHLRTEEYAFWDIPEEDDRYAVKWFYCDALDTFLHSAALAGKNKNHSGWAAKHYKQAMADSQLMPKTCSKYESQNY